VPGKEIYRKGKGRAILRILAKPRTEIKKPNLPDRLQSARPFGYHVRPEKVNAQRYQEGQQQGCMPQVYIAEAKITATTKRQATLKNH
jgi:hypothetical protein